MKIFNIALDISLQNLLYKNIIRDMPPRGRWLGEFEQRADSLEHIARGRWLRAFEQGADSLEHLDRGHMVRGISPET